MISFYDRELDFIDSKILNVDPVEIPKLFERIPLGVFGLLQYGEQAERYKKISKYMPTMASDDDQLGWTGDCGVNLLKQSIDFVKSAVHFYEMYTKNNIERANFLDFGCGWGRLTRLMLKYIPHEQIYAVDPWDKAIEKCRELNVHGSFGQTEYICNSLPFRNISFDLVISFSVFTHLSLKACTAALQTIRSCMAEEGVLAITVRPRDYWALHGNTWCKDISINSLLSAHDTVGYAFCPHDIPINDKVDYGDTSISIVYIQENWKDWEIIGFDESLLDTYQQVVFLKPRK